MKRLLIATTFLGASVLGVAPLSGQLFTLGVKGGATFASVSDADGVFDDIGSRTGSVFGASVKIGGRVGVRGELLFVQKGFDASESGADFAFDVDYVEIPILLVVRLGEGAIRPGLYGGAAVGFERNCRVTISGAQANASGDCDVVDPELEREEMDAAAVFGGELAFSLGGVDAVVDGRYTLGVTTLDASDDPDDVRNRAFMLMAGLEIPIG